MTLAVLSSTIKIEGERFQRTQRKRGIFTLKKTLFRLLSALCAGSVLLSSAMAANIADFPDAAGHWAHADLSRAVDDGMLHGDGSRLNPNGSLTTAQMVAILNRTLQATDASRTYPGTPDGQWYTADAHKGASLGILPSDGSLGLNDTITRAQAFQAIAAAFGLEEAEPDESVLSSFADAKSLTPAQRRAAAVLVRDGIVAGAENGSLDASRGMTRAEFVSLMYRIVNETYLTIHHQDGADAAPSQTPEEIPDEPDASKTPEAETPGAPSDSTEEPSDTPDSPSEEPASPEEPSAGSDQPDDTEPADGTAAEDGGTAELPEQKTPSAEEEDEPVSPKPSRVLLYTTQPQGLSGSYERVVLRGENMAPAFTEGDPVSIDRLVLGTTGADFALENKNGNTFSTVVIGGGTGKATLSGDVTRSVEITGSNRVVELRGMTLDRLAVSGIGNTIILDAGTSIASLSVLKGAAYNHVTVNGSAGSASLAGANSVLTGSGHADTVTITGKYCTNSLSADTVDDRSDTGLDGVKLSLSAPKVAPGGQVTATVTITGMDKERVCAAQWYYDGKPDTGFANSALAVSEGRTSAYSHPVTFTKDMALSHTVGFGLTYLNPATGDTETRYAETKVTIENYPDSHYLPDASTVLAKVNSTYRRGNTDYTQNEKVVFVNAKGYSSPTKYLIWVSRSAQKVNVFEGSRYNWKLIHEFDCATGASSTPTPVGVTYVTYKQTNWTTSSYTCRPIVRFYPNTGYAFHSRLYYPNSDRLKDGTMGRPASHGCVRMMDEGIYWLYNNVPTKTTVVIF